MGWRFGSKQIWEMVITAAVTDTAPTKSETDFIQVIIERTNRFLCSRGEPIALQPEGVRKNLSNFLNIATDEVVVRRGGTLAVTTCLDAFEQDEKPASRDEWRLMFNFQGKYRFYIYRNWLVDLHRRGTDLGIERLRVDVLIRRVIDHAEIITFSEAVRRRGGVIWQWTTR